jgi:putative ABC transport system permease protein
MIAHLWKLIWNRKRANALVLAELTAAFLVLAGLCTAAAYFYGNARRPLGYTIDDVWVSNVGHGIAREEGVPPEVMARAQAAVRQLLQAVRELPEVEAVAGVLTGPYVSGTRSTQTMSGDEMPPLGQGLSFDIDIVTDDFARVLGLTVTAGRWFGKEDDGAAYRPAVINERMARDFFGAASPLGQRLGSAGGLPVRVVGVVAGYRQRGQLAPPHRYMFQRHRLLAAQELPYQKLFVRTRPGTGAGFEETLEQRLHAAAPREWEFDVRRLTAVREGVRKVALMPLTAAAIVGSFLMLMVVLGLTGVLWQNVTQRTREIGLRRAKGATRLHIHGQILGEVMVMTGIAVALGALLLAHVPFLGLVGDVEPGVYLGGGAAAALIIAALALLCGFYPARLAAAVQPAQALRSE